MVGIRSKQLLFKLPNPGGEKLDLVVFLSVPGVLEINLFVQFLNLTLKPGVLKSQAN